MGINHFRPWISDRLRDFHQAVVVSVSLATGSLEIEFVCHNLGMSTLLEQTQCFPSSSLQRLSHSASMQNGRNETPDPCVSSVGIGCSTNLTTWRPDHGQVS